MKKAHFPPKDICLPKKCVKILQIYSIIFVLVGSYDLCYDLMFTILLSHLDLTEIIG